MVRELDGCEIGALVAPASEEAGCFSVKNTLQWYPFGSVKEAVFVGYKIHFVTQKRRVSRGRRCIISHIVL